MSAVVELVEDIFDFAGDVIDSVGDAVESVGDAVSGVLESVGDAVGNALKNPLPIIVSMAGMAVGIPPMLTNAVMTAAQGGSIEDMVLSAGISYLAPVASNSISSTLSSAIGDSIVNETVSNAVVNSVSSGLVNGVVSEIKGGDFQDGFAGAFTGGLVGAGVTEVSNFVQPQITEAMDSLGLDQSTISTISNVGTKALTSGLTAEITGKGNFAKSFTNSVVNMGANIASGFATDSIAKQFDNVTTVDKQLTGAENGDVKDQDQIKAELTDAWANQDIKSVNRIIGTSNLSTEDTKAMFDLTDDDLVALQDSGVNFKSGEDTKATTDLTDISSGETIGTGAGIPASLVNEVEVSDIGVDNQPGSAASNYASDDISGTKSISTVSGSTTPSTGAPTRDTLIPPAVSDVSDLVSQYAPAAPKLPQDMSPRGVVSGALNQFLKPAIATGITRSLIKPPAPPPRPMRPRPPAVMTQRPAPQSIMPPQNVMPENIMPQKVAPKPGVPVMPALQMAQPPAATPISNISGLTAILNQKG